MLYCNSAYNNYLRSVSYTHLDVYKRQHSNITFLSFNIWFDNWKMDLKHYDIIIICAAKLNGSIAKWRHSKYPNIRIIFWFWNPIKKNFIPDNNLKKRCL